MTRRPRSKTGVHNYDKQAYMRPYLEQRNRERREAIDKIKEVPCADCKQVFPPACMDFDHLDGNEKLFDIGRGRLKPWNVLMAEIAKCEVVCANCHRLRTEARRHERKHRESL